MKHILLPGLLAGLAMVAISFILTMILGALVPSIMAEYQTVGLFRPWSDPLMSLMYVEPFILGIILAWIWNFTKSCFKTTKCCPPGILFGLGYWVLTIPGMIMSYGSFPISLAMTCLWSFTILLQSLITGTLLAKMNK